MCGLLFGWGGYGASSVLGEEPSTAKLSQVLYLHTEFLPYRKPAEQGRHFRLNREIIRQAILLTARDELGLAARDETLQEAIPAHAQVVYLMPMERADATGKWRVKIVSMDDPTTPWEKTYDYVADTTKAYGDILPKLEIDTRSALQDGLRAVGLQGARPSPQSAAPPGPEIEAWLGQVDGGAQFAAVRAAHRAIAAHGETFQRLGVLVRGYADLALLTGHY
jgi:hypothetical protein